jgi:hypothetical protein
MSIPRAVRTALVVILVVSLAACGSGTKTGSSATARTTPDLSTSPPQPPTTSGQTLANRLAIFNAQRLQEGGAGEGLGVAGNWTVPTSVAPGGLPVHYTVSDVLRYLDQWIHEYSGGITSAGPSHDERWLYGVCEDPTVEPCLTTLKTMGESGPTDIWSPDWSSGTPTKSDTNGATPIAGVGANGTIVLKDMASSEVNTLSGADLRWDVTIHFVDGRPFFKSVVRATLPLNTTTTTQP